MGTRNRNIIWAGFLAVLFFLYYEHVASYWVGKEGVDPLLVNFVIAPALFGFAALFWLNGTLFEKILFLLLIPIIPCLILGQEEDPAKPGLQWILITSIQLPYWLGGLLAFWGRRFMTPNKSTQPTQ